MVNNQAKILLRCICTNIVHSIQLLYNYVNLTKLY
nr:MAG TPA: hypothetical protein [Caudoviricetes sp.]